MPTYYRLCLGAALWLMLWFGTIAAFQGLTSQELPAVGNADDRLALAIYDSEHDQAIGRVEACVLILVILLPIGGMLLVGRPFGRN